MAVLWLPRALAKLERVLDDFENEAAEERFREMLAAQERRILAQPRSGTAVREWPRLPFRQFLVGRYRFFYHQDAKGTLWVVDMWHAAQRADAPELPAPPR